MELRDTIALEVMKVLIDSTYRQRLSAADFADLRESIPWTAYEYADNMLAARDAGSIAVSNATAELDITGV